MKKFLVMMLVLGIASAANATLVSLRADGADVDSVDITVGDTLQVGVYGDEGGSYDAYLALVVPATAAWTGDVTEYDLTPGDPITAVTYYGEAIAGYDVYLLNNSTTNLDNQPAAGLGFEVALECLDLGDVQIQLHNDTWGNVVDTLTISQIPEPATLALLGLGGLFLRKRRK